MSMTIAPSNPNNDKCYIKRPTPFKYIFHHRVRRPYGDGSFRCAINSTDSTFILSAFCAPAVSRATGVYEIRSSSKHRSLFALDSATPFPQPVSLSSHWGTCLHTQKFICRRHEATIQILLLLGCEIHIRNIKAFFLVVPECLKKRDYSVFVLCCLFLFCRINW